MQNFWNLGGCKNASNDKSAVVEATGRAPPRHPPGRQQNPTRFPDPGVIIDERLAFAR